MALQLHRGLARLGALLLMSAVLLALSVPAARASQPMMGARPRPGMRMRATTAAHVRPHQIGKALASPARAARPASVSALTLALIAGGSAGIVGALLVAGLLMMRRDERLPECETLPARC